MSMGSHFLFYLSSETFIWHGPLEVKGPDFNEDPGMKAKFTARVTPLTTKDEFYLRPRTYIFRFLGFYRQQFCLKVGDLKWIQG